MDNQPNLPALSRSWAYPVLSTGHTCPADTDT